MNVAGQHATSSTIGIYAAANVSVAEKRKMNSTIGIYARVYVRGVAQSKLILNDLDNKKGDFNRYINDITDENFLISIVDKILSNKKAFFPHGRLGDLLHTRMKTMPKLTKKIITDIIEHDINRESEPSYIIDSCNRWGLSWAAISPEKTMRSLLQFIMNNCCKKWVEHKNEIPSILEQIYHQKPNLRNAILKFNHVKVQESSKEVIHRFTGEPDIGIPGKPELYLSIEIKSENTIEASLKEQL